MIEFREWIAAKGAWLIFAIGLVVIVATVISVRSCSTANGARTETTLAIGQAGAAAESGADAVNTVGNRAQAEEQTDAISRENDAAIRNAEGATTVVPAAVSSAGISALCRRAAYQGDPRCSRPQ